MAGKSFVFRFADVEVREREFSLTKAGERIAIEPKAFRILLILLRNPQKLFPKDELLTGATLPSRKTPSPAALPSSAASLAMKPTTPASLKP